MFDIKSFANYISMRRRAIQNILNSLQPQMTYNLSSCRQNLYLPKTIPKLISEYDYDIKGCGETIKCSSKYDAILPDGRVITGLTYNGYVSYGNTIKIWNLLTGDYISATDYFQFSDSIGSFAILPDGRIFSGAYNHFNGNVKILNPYTNTCDLTIVEPHSTWISCAAILSEKQIVTACGHNTLKVWNLQSGDCEVTFNDDDNSKCLGVLPDGRIINGTYYGAIKIWNPLKKTCDVVLRNYSSRDYTNGVVCISILSDGRIISGMYDGTILIWNLTTGCHDKFLEDHASSVNCIALLPDGRIVSGSSDHSLKIWDPNTRKCTNTLFGHVNRVVYVAVITDGRIISGSTDKILRLWS